ncbi:MAG: hybrid sensor histidine kinase/response regulator [Bacteroidales bacterium]|nr:hybrid sensor histidine kinase/response regulator [Bacteroidales bacterium]
METLHVLVVDDEPGIRSGIIRVLGRHTVGYPFMEEDFTFELHEAESGEKAIEILESTSIDIVLLDNKLPGISGIEVLEYIKEKNFDVSVMMITSYASLDLAVKAINNGAYNFVPKPFTPEELKGAIESIAKNLYLKRMTREMNREGREAKFQFLSVLSHELKSPLNAIEGYLRIMSDRQAGNNLEDYDAMIDRSMERIKGMRSLIMDLLDLTRIENGSKQRRIVKNDIIDIIRASVQMFEPMAEQRHIKMELISPDELYLLSDKDECSIIINNLISNAIKYNKDFGKVTCTVRKEKGKISISVSDTGVGMSEEEKALLFQDFVRIKNEKTRNIAGSGLGLSIVKKLVEMNEGNIEVESYPDKGTTFTVCFAE